MTEAPRLALTRFFLTHHSTITIIYQSITYIGDPLIVQLYDVIDDTRHVLVTAIEPIINTIHNLGAR